MQQPAELLKGAIESFSDVTLTQVVVFLIPFVLAVCLDLRAHKAGHQVTMADAATWSVI
jgi:tellurite resistance protein TerC